MFAYNPKPKAPIFNCNTSVSPNSESLPRVVSLSQAKQLHARLVIFGLASHGKSISHLLSSLALSLSSKPKVPLRLLRYCFTLYNSFQRPPSVFVANNLIRCFAKSPFPRESVSLYSSLLRCFEKRPNRRTFTFLLQSCSNSSASGEGLQIHCHVVKLGFASDVFVTNALLGFYSRCFGSDLSCRVFDERVIECRDLVTYNTMLTGLVRDGRVKDAENLFDEMPERDIISWSTMIMGYVQNGSPEEALNRFREVVDMGLRPNEAMVVSALSATSQLGLLENGKFIHSLIESLNLPMTVTLATCLIDMYAKCGLIERSKLLFESMPKNNIWTWNVMICGLASHGLGRETLTVFENFCAEKENKKGKFIPSNVTFIGVLTGCSKSGLVKEGRHYFNLMTEFYGLKPEMEHYGCMVDLFGRAGLIEEAVEFIEKMDISPDPVLWATLLGSCRVHNRVDLGEKIGIKLIELDPSHGGHYVQLSSFYAKSQKWDHVARVRRLMFERNTKKTIAWSLLEVQGKVHRFLSGDTYHERYEEIREVLEEIQKRVFRFGHSPDISPVLHDIGEEEKELAIGEHSERLAIAFGLLVTKSGECIRVVKNLRVCEDCHEVTKIISKEFDREIVVRDGSRFHHFKHGKCSCNDFW